MQKNILIALGTFLLGLVVGVLVLNYSPLAGKLNLKAAKIDKASPLLKTQMALIDGKVTKVDGNKVLIENTDKQSGEFMASDKLVIYKRDPKQPLAQAFAGVSSIEVGQDARFVLELEEGAFRVTNIHYSVQATAVSTPPKTTTSSASPKP